MPSFSAFGVPVVLLSSIDDILIDVVEEVTVREESLVTKHPTESQLNVTDNVVNLPVVITLAGRFVDVPLSVGGASFFNPAAGLTGALSTIQSVGGLSPGRANSFWLKLEQLRNEKRRFDVSIQQRLYTGMVFKSIEAPRNPGDGSSQRFRAEMHEIITVSAAGEESGISVEENVEHTALSSITEGVKGVTAWLP